jgi:competence protein ComGC
MRPEDAFGLIELMIAMGMLNVGILAIVAAFTSGQVALRNAGRTATAASLAETQMELYRALKWDSIRLDATSIGSVDTTYKCDSALPVATPCSATPTVTRTDCTGTPLPNECLPTRTATGADGKSYRVDTYIVAKTVTNGRDVRRVTVVVRNPAAVSGVPLARQSSDFDESTAT